MLFAACIPVRCGGSHGENKSLSLSFCLMLLTGCPGRGDYYRFDETVTVSTRGDNVCFSIPEPEDCQPVSVSIAPRETRFRDRQITFEPSLRIVNGQLCIPPSLYLIPDKGQFIVRSVLHSECDKDTPCIMVAGIAIADRCIFDIPLNDMKAVRPYE